MEFSKHRKMYVATGILAAVLFGAAALFNASTNRLVDNRAFSFGTIVSVNQSSGRLGFATPVVRFQANKAEVQAPGQNYNVLGSFRVGQRVSVMYDPQNPINVRLVEPGQLWRTTYVLVLLGAIPAVLFLLTFLHDIIAAMESGYGGQTGSWPTAPPRPTPAA